MADKIVWKLTNHGVEAFEKARKNPNASLNIKYFAMLCILPIYRTDNIATVLGKMGTVKDVSDLERVDGISYSVGSIITDKHNTSSKFMFPITPGMNGKSYATIFLPYPNPDKPDTRTYAFTDLYLIGAYKDTPEAQGEFIVLAHFSIWDDDVFGTDTYMVFSGNTKLNTRYRISFTFNETLDNVEAGGIVSALEMIDSETEVSTKDKGAPEYVTIPDHHHDIDTLRSEHARSVYLSDKLMSDCKILEYWYQKYKPYFLKNRSDFVFNDEWSIYNSYDELSEFLFTVEAAMLEEYKENNSEDYNEYKAFGIVRKKLCNEYLLRGLMSPECNYLSLADLQNLSTTNTFFFENLYAKRLPQKDDTGVFNRTIPDSINGLSRNMPSVLYLLSEKYGVLSNSPVYRFVLWQYLMENVSLHYILLFHLIWTQNKQPLQPLVSSILLPEKIEISDSINPRTVIRLGGTINMDAKDYFIQMGIKYSHSEEYYPSYLSSYDGKPTSEYLADLIGNLIFAISDTILRNQYYGDDTTIDLYYYTQILNLILPKLTAVGQTRDVRTYVAEEYFKCQIDGYDLYSIFPHFGDVDEIDQEIRGERRDILTYYCMWKESKKPHTYIQCKIPGSKYGTFFGLDVFSEDIEYIKNEDTDTIRTEMRSDSTQLDSLRTMINTPEYFGLKNFKNNDNFQPLIMEYINYKLYIIVKFNAVSDIAIYYNNYQISLFEDKLVEFYKDFLTLMYESVHLQYEFEKGKERIIVRDVTHYVAKYFLTHISKRLDALTDNGQKDTSWKDSFLTKLESAFSRSPKLIELIKSHLPSYITRQ